ncbi:nuclear transport factor 2 family protein [Lysobacter sp. KIS68-7]|uniref:nuclear transport factor 2 family protein n=1 Tax=Lysobacter sp. KIS68-7 TaxID=2904252 RepID=UPI001E541DB0|nr:nuclear transport factor 2 family protein [Lysobacter sp. KIS68-7]UHQ19400.1 nuclear transport factor 2 family protein [Lysobacter sp. KIS68-7]
MKIALPTPIKLYLQADADKDESLFTQCFAPDAEVRDEGRTIKGVEAIRVWKRDAKKKYQYEVHPLAALQDGDMVSLTARLTGKFPGSPVELTYAFVLRDDRIASLEIR